MWYCLKCSASSPSRPGACPSCGAEISRIPPGEQPPAALPGRPTDPPRPASVPEGAVWVEADREWELATLALGEKHGPVRWWRPDGTLCAEAEHTHGVMTGPFTRHHENGEPSQWGQLKNGQRVGIITWQRSTAPTTENTVPKGAGKNVWRSQQEMFENGTVGPPRYFDREGKEVDMSGKAKR